MKFVIRYDINFSLFIIFFIIKKGPDPSPHEFPIFNVSHNPNSPYPNPINHLYDKRYKEAYSTFIKQNQPAPSTSQKNEPSTPTSPTSAQPAINPNSSPYTTYPQSQLQQQTSKQAPQPSGAAPSFHQQQTSRQAPQPSGAAPSFHQQQTSRQAPQPSGTAPSFHQQPTSGWRYMNPYATMPRSHAAHYQQQAAKIMQPIQEQPSTNNNQSIRRSSTGEDFQSHSLSRSASSNDLNYSTNSGAEKIRVRVINDNSSSSSGTTNPQTNLYSNNRSNTQRSILKSQNDSGNNKESMTTRTIYATPNTEIGTETMEDILKVVNNQRSDPAQSTSSPVKERIIIIDRRGSNTPDNNQNSSGTERYRAFEVRSSTAAAAPPSTPTPTTTTATPATPTTSTPSTAYTMQQPNYYMPQQQLYYQQPKMYSSVPSNLYSAATPYVPRCLITCIHLDIIAIEFK